MQSPFHSENIVRASALGQNSLLYKWLCFRKEQINRSSRNFLRANSEPLLNAIAAQCNCCAVQSLLHVMLGAEEGTRTAASWNLSKSNHSETCVAELAKSNLCFSFQAFPAASSRCRSPLRALRGFQRVLLESGVSQDVEFHLSPRDLSMVTQAGDIIVAYGKYTIAIGRGQPGTDAPSVSGSFEVNGEISLPE